MATNLAAHVTDADIEQMHDHAIWSHFESYQQRRNFGAESDFYDPAGSESSIVATPHREHQEEEE